MQNAVKAIDVVRNVKIGQSIYLFYAENQAIIKTMGFSPTMGPFVRKVMVTILEIIK